MQILETFFLLVNFFFLRLQVLVSHQGAFSFRSLPGIVIVIVYFLPNF